MDRLATQAIAALAALADLAVSQALVDTLARAYQELADTVVLVAYQVILVAAYLDIRVSVDIAVNKVHPSTLKARWRIQRFCHWLAIISMMLTLLIQMVIYIFGRELLGITLEKSLVLLVKAVFQVLVDIQESAVLAVFQESLASVDLVDLVALVDLAGLVFLDLVVSLGFLALVVIAALAFLVGQAILEFLGSQVKVDYQATLDTRVSRAILASQEFRGVLDTLVYRDFPGVTVSVVTRESWVLPDTVDLRVSVVTLE